MAFNNFNQILKADESSQFIHDMSVYGHHWRLILTDGLALLVLAFVAFLLPLISATQVSRGLAVVFLFLGITYLTQAIEFKLERGSLIRLFQASLSFVIGGIFFRYSGSGMMGITMGLTFYFLLGAVLSWVFYSEVKPHSGWSWGFVSAIFSFLLGLYMAVIFPFAPLWLPGTLLGLELLISSSGMLGLALSLRRFESPSPSDQKATTYRDPQNALVHNKHFHT